MLVNAFGSPSRHPRLALLNRFIGTWLVAGDPVGHSGNSIKGQLSARWLPGGHFLQQHITLDFVGLPIDSLEIVRYDEAAESFTSTVYSNRAPTPLPYTWEVDGEWLTIGISHGDLGTTFRGSFRDDGSFAGEWRPDPGADETVNIPYDLSGERVE